MYALLWYRSDATLHTPAGACIKTHVDWLSTRVYHYIARMQRTTHVKLDTHV